MIVESMTYDEVYREIERDIPSIKRWYAHKLNTMLAILRSRTRFVPLSFIFEYVSPGWTRYLTVTTALDKRVKNAVCAIAALRPTQYGTEVFLACTPGHEHSRTVITPHCWQRYAERMGFDMTGTRLIAHFMMHNTNGGRSDDIRAVAHSVRYNGEEHRAIIFPDGVLLGALQDGVYVMRTFVTYEMLGAVQRDIIEDKRANIYSLYDMTCLINEDHAERVEREQYRKNIMQIAIDTARGKQKNTK